MLMAEVHDTGAHVRLLRHTEHLRGGGDGHAANVRGTFLSAAYALAAVIFMSCAAS
jgi:hypothetical protein